MSAADDPDIQREWVADAPKPVKGVTAPDPWPYTLTTTAKLLGIHRVTLLRMEQQGKIEPAKWRAKPTPHRVYSKTDVTAIKHTLRQKLVERYGGVITDENG